MLSLGKLAGATNGRATRPQRPRTQGVTIAASGALTERFMQAKWRLPTSGIGFLISLFEA